MARVTINVFLRRANSLARVTFIVLHVSEVKTRSTHTMSPDLGGLWWDPSEIVLWSTGLFQPSPHSRCVLNGNLGGLVTMITRSLDIKNDLFRPKDDDEEIWELKLHILV